MPPALFSARIDDLLPDRLLKVQCGGCEHVSEVPTGIVKVKLPVHFYVSNLGYVLRRTACGFKGKATHVDAMKALGW